MVEHIVPHRDHPHGTPSSASARGPILRRELAECAKISIVLPESPRRPEVRIDYLGAVLLTGGATSVILFTTWGGSEYPCSSPVIVGLMVAAVQLSITFVAIERRVREPLLPERLFRSRTFSVSVVVCFILGVAMYGAISFLPLFLQIVAGSSATDSGLLILPLMLGFVVASVTAGQIMTRTGRYKVFPSWARSRSRPPFYFLG